MKPDNPVKDGYTFQNWNVDELLTREFDFNTHILQNITLYAKWLIKSEQTKTNVTITFDSNGGSEIQTRKILYGSKVLEPTIPIKDGYTFQGWYTNSELTDLFSFSSIITADIVVPIKYL